MWKRRSKRLARFLAIAALVCVAGLAVLKVWLDASYFDGYDPNAPLNLELALVEERQAYTWTKFYYAGARGDRVPAVMATPK
ncbi:MAG TPA: hypothetical protein PKK20_10120, partial [Verrucomicrobiota bacterium]|nr:hypothetical protein [Verrucomicrobiota bacterium]